MCVTRSSRSVKRTATLYTQQMNELLKQQFADLAGSGAAALRHYLVQSVISVITVIVHLVVVIIVLVVVSIANTNMRSVSAGSRVALAIAIAIG